jgi:predicted helicase
MATFSDLFARLDPDPRVRGRQFEHVCKWFLTNDPTYKNTLRRLWLWSEWTGRWGADSGIDLVAEDHDGRMPATETMPSFALSTAARNQFNRAEVPSRCGSAGWIRSPPAAASTGWAVGGADSPSPR